MVIDTSAILAIIFEEKHARWATDQLQLHASNLYMSTVNLTEALILIQSRQPNNYTSIQETLLSSGIIFISPDLEQAKFAAYARNKYPLNLGDCFAFALAFTKDDTILAIDRDFRKTECKVLLPPQ